VTGVLPRLHALVIGPGLGRDPTVLSAVADIIVAAREASLPLVLDADALWLVTERIDLVAGYAKCVLTPNVREFGRLADAVTGRSDAPIEEVCVALAGGHRAGPIIVQKGPRDLICGYSELSSVKGGGKSATSKSVTLFGKKVDIVGEEAHSFAYGDEADATEGGAEGEGAGGRGGSGDGGGRGGRGEGGRRT
jgi:ATP-dependent NAD(P)H-hydrate dehydratase